MKSHFWCLWRWNISSAWSCCGFSLRLKGRLRSFASEKSFSAFAFVQDEEFQQSGSKRGGGGAEKMWGNNGALHIIQDDMKGGLPNLWRDVTFIQRCRFHTSPPCARHYRPCCGFSPKIGAEFNERKERITRGGCTGRKACGRPRGRDKWELEVSKTPRCDDSKVSYPTKQQVRTNYSMWPRGLAAGSLSRKAASVDLEKGGQQIHRCQTC